MKSNTTLLFLSVYSILLKVTGIPLSINGKISEDTNTYIFHLPIQMPLFNEYLIEQHTWNKTKMPTPTKCILSFGFL